MIRGRVRFGPFEFERSTGELWREGRRAQLQRQPARLLDLLLARPGELVTREEIRQALWGDDVHVDFDRSLNFCVRKLRGALQDDVSAPRFVETVPTRGYRFIAATEYTDKKATEYTEHTDEKAAERTGRTATERTERARSVGRVFRPGALVAAAVVILVLGGAAALGLTLHRAAGPPKIVVVPFHNETGSPDFDRVAKGVSDAAVARLASPERLPRLKVIGNATDVSFSFRPRDMKAVGQALDAQYLVLGQLKKDNAHFRVIAHLIRVSDQTHVWAKAFDRDTLDLATQSAIAEDIARAVSTHLPS